MTDGKEDEEKKKMNKELWDACEKGDLSTVEGLIAKGADANWINPWGPPGRALQFTCLHIASNNNHIAVVKHLCEKGKVNMDKKCPYGETAYQHVQGLSGVDEITAYLKMKTAMNAVLAANRFKAKMSKKGAEIAAS